MHIWNKCQSFFYVFVCDHIHWKYVIQYSQINRKNTNNMYTVGSRQHSTQTRVLCNCFVEWFWSGRELVFPYLGSFYILKSSSVDTISWRTFDYLTYLRQMKAYTKSLICRRRSFVCVCVCVFPQFSAWQMLLIYNCFNECMCVGVTQYAHLSLHQHKNTMKIEWKHHFHNPV